MTMINQSQVLNIAGDGVYSDEFELTISPSFPSDCLVRAALYRDIQARVMIFDMPVRNTNTQVGYLRGMPIVRRGRTQYEGQATATFVEGLNSEVSEFIQHWLDVYEYDATGSKSRIKQVMLNFTLTQYKPDRAGVSRRTRLYWCLPNTANPIDGGHAERAEDITRSTLTVHYTTSRTGLTEADLTLLSRYYSS